MPLRKPGEVAHIPKTRKKSITKIKSATPEKKKKELEYRASLYFQYDAIEKKQYYIISVNTVKEFTFLNYELSIGVQKKKDAIDLSLLGLSATHSYLVQPQPAKLEIRLEDLYGTFTVSFIKPDGSINSFVVEFNIFKKSITIEKEIIPRKKNNHKFVTLDTSPSLNTFAKDFNTL
ncbi:MAG: hypothetical protein LWX56_10335 [Ignavibacteria bacterium]|nr:hypothetical protein [Ignavibacteria bacterium]